MHSPVLHRLLADARRAELLRAAARGRRNAPAPRRRARHRRADGVALELAVTIRYAFPDDAFALRRLAALDSSEVPRSPVLLCEVGGELQAALSLADGAVVSDPFRRTSALVELLAARAQQLQADFSGRRFLRPSRQLKLRRATIA